MMYRLAVGSKLMQTLQKRWKHFHVEMKIQLQEPVNPARLDGAFL